MDTDTAFTKLRKDAAAQRKLLRRILAVLESRADPDNDHSYTIAQFCRAEQIDRDTYYEMKKEGRGPREMRPAERAPRISAEARRDWQRARETEAAAKNTAATDIAAAAAIHEARLDNVAKNANFMATGETASPPQDVINCFEVLAKLITASEKFPNAANAFIELQPDFTPPPPVSQTAVLRLANWLVDLTRGWRNRNSIKRLAKGGRTSGC